MCCPRLGPQIAAPQDFHPPTHLESPEPHTTFTGPWKTLLKTGSTVERHLLPYRIKVDAAKHLEPGSHCISISWACILLKATLAAPTNGSPNWISPTEANWCGQRRLLIDGEGTTSSWKFTSTASPLPSLNVGAHLVHWALGGLGMALPQM